MFKELYETGKPFNTTKNSSIKNITEGSVVIEDSNIELSLIYNKRNKIKDTNGRWIDTSPLVINECGFIKGLNTNFIFYNTCSTDFIFYNTCCTDFVLHGFYFYNTILPAIVYKGYEKTNLIVYSSLASAGSGGIRLIPNVVLSIVVI